MLYKYIPTLILVCLLSLNFNPYAEAQSRYSKLIGLDVLHNDKHTSLRFRMGYAYQITPTFSAGIGTGFTYYDDPLSVVPLYIDITYSLGKGDAIPFLFLRSGYSFSILTDTDVQVDEHEGGYLLNPGAGIRFATKSGVGFYFSVGYNLNHSLIRNERGTNRTVQTDITYERLMVGVGLLF